MKHSKKRPNISAIWDIAGKLAIHPKQVAPIQEVFTPSDAEIESAQKLIAAFNANQDAGTGVFEYEGKMIDMPMIRAALGILERAKACGILGDDVELLKA